MRFLELQELPDDSESTSFVDEHLGNQEQEAGGSSENTQGEYTTRTCLRSNLYFLTDRGGFKRRTRFPREEARDVVPTKKCVSSFPLGYLLPI